MQHIVHKINNQGIETKDTLFSNPLYEQDVSHIVDCDEKKPAFYDTEAVYFCLNSYPHLHIISAFLSQNLYKGGIYLASIILQQQSQGQFFNLCPFMSRESSKKSSASFDLSSTFRRLQKLKAKKIIRVFVNADLNGFTHLEARVSPFF